MYVFTCGYKSVKREDSIDKNVRLFRVQTRLPVKRGRQDWMSEKLECQEQYKNNFRNHKINSVNKQLQLSSLKL